MTDSITVEQAQSVSGHVGETYSDALNAMASEFRHLHAAGARSELAALRRLNHRHPDQSAFFRLLARNVPDRFLGRGDLKADAPGSRLDMVRRWALVALIMAQRPDGLISKNSLGKSLEAIGFSDQRLNMLLNARGQTFRDLALRAARRLARSEEGLPYRELGRLILLESRPEHDAAAEKLRIDIAMDFQRASGAGAEPQLDA